MKISGAVEIKIDGGLDIPSIMMLRVEQNFPRPQIQNIESKIHSEMNKEEIRTTVKQGMKIAVCVGSRGIPHLPVIIRTIIDVLKKWGAVPFIVPSMGSHGGATVDGQKQVLYDLGITEEAMGVDICSSMEVICLGTAASGLSVFFDRLAYEADLIIPINKIKSHTEFKGEFESGIMKMLAIGLGNHKGASYYHRQGFKRFREIIPEIGQYVIDNAPIGFSIMMVENSYKELADLQVVLAQDTMSVEPLLLKRSKELMSKIEVDEIDVLIVDQIGKNISGPGMDSNITGRASAGIDQNLNAPKIQRIVILDLTDETHGNGIGIGFADVMPMRILNKLDFTSIYSNAITAGQPAQAMIPIVANTDLEALVIALRTCAGIELEKAKIVRIKNTGSLSEILVSSSLVEQVRKRNNCKIHMDGELLSFDKDGNMHPFRARQ